MTRTYGGTAGFSRRKSHPPSRSTHNHNLYQLQGELLLRTSALGTDHPCTLEIASAIVSLEAEARENRKPTVRARLADESHEEKSSESVAQVSETEPKGAPLFASEDEQSSHEEIGQVSDFDDDEEEEDEEAESNLLVRSSSAPPPDFWPGTKRCYGKGASQSRPGGNPSDTSQVSCSGGGSPVVAVAESSGRAAVAAAAAARPAAKAKIAYARKAAIAASTNKGEEEPGRGGGDAVSRSNRTSRGGGGGGTSPGLSAAEEAELERQRAYFDDVDSFEVDIDSSVDVGVLSAPSGGGAAEAAGGGASARKQKRCPSPPGAEKPSKRQRVNASAEDDPAVSDPRVVSAYGAYAAALTELGSGVSPLPLREFAANRDTFLFGDCDGAFDGMFDDNGSSGKGICAF